MTFSIFLLDKIIWLLKNSWLLKWLLILEVHFSNLFRHELAIFSVFFYIFLYRLLKLLKKLETIIHRQK